MSGYAAAQIEEVLFTPKQIAERVAELGRVLTERYRGKRPICLCVLRGASFFYTDLCRQMDCPLDVDFIAVTSYGKSTVSSGTISMRHDTVFNVSGREVLIVEDVVDTGLTLRHLKKLLYDRGAVSVETVAFLDKKECHLPEDATDYYGFQIPNRFVVGYGLDYADQYRNLPYIAVLDRSAVH